MGNKAKRRRMAESDDDEPSEDDQQLSEVRHLISSTQPSRSGCGSGGPTAPRAAAASTSSAASLLISVSRRDAEQQCCDQGRSVVADTSSLSILLGCGAVGGALHAMPPEEPASLTLPASLGFVLCAGHGGYRGRRRCIWETTSHLRRGGPTRKARGHRLEQRGAQHCFCFCC
jgi:hypothetical protein